MADDSGATQNGILDFCGQLSSGEIKIKKVQLLLHLFELSGDPFLVTPTRRLSRINVA